LARPSIFLAKYKKLAATPTKLSHMVTKTNLLNNLIAITPKKNNLIAKVFA